MTSALADRLRAEKYASDLTNFGPLHARISYASDDGKEKGSWEFYPDHWGFSYSGDTVGHPRPQDVLLKAHAGAVELKR